MVKKTLIAVAVVSMIMASFAQAQIKYLPTGPVEHRGRNLDSGGADAIKVNISEYKGNNAIGWPFEYVALDLCVIPVYMHVGFYIQVKECWKKSITLKQTDCADIGFVEDTAKFWPCYTGCTSMEVTSNFEAQLGLKLEKGDTGIIKDWKTYFDDDFDGVMGPGKKTVKICVDAWKARLYNSEAPNTKVRVGTVRLTVKPLI